MNKRIKKKKLKIKTGIIKDRMRNARRNGECIQVISQSAIKRNGLVVGVRVHDPVIKIIKKGGVRRGE